MPPAPPAAPGTVTVNDRSTGLRIDTASALSAAAALLTIAGSDHSLMIDLSPGSGNAGADANSPVLTHFVDMHITAANFSFG